MKKVNLHDVSEDEWESPKGGFHAFGKGLSEALGRVRTSTDVLLRHPFDVEWCRIPPGAKAFPYHSHSAQFEFYYVLSGVGTVRDQDGSHTVTAGDAFLYKPSEAHQLANTGNEDFVYLVVADNPLGEACHYPDSGKWAVGIPERRIMRGEALEYFDGEE